MNMILHGVENFRIEHENVLTNPLLIEDGSLIKYDRVIANFPFSMDWDNTRAAKDFIWFLTCVVSRGIGHWIALRALLLRPSLCKKYQPNTSCTK
jgi:hypothetical protein